MNKLDIHEYMEGNRFLINWKLEEETKTRLSIGDVTKEIVFFISSINKSKKQTKWRVILSKYIKNSNNQEPNNNEPRVDIHVGDFVQFTLVNEDGQQMAGKVKSIKGNDIIVIVKTIGIINDEIKSMKKLCKIEIKPNPLIYKRIIEGIEKLPTLNDGLQNILIRKYQNRLQMNNQLNIDVSIPLNESQRNAVIAALSNHLTIIQGPPGTGKTHTIGAIVVQSLMIYPYRKVHVCGTTNSSISSLLEIIGNIVSNAGYELCFLHAKSQDFKTFEDMKKGQEYSSLYKIMNLGTKNSKRFKELFVYSQNNQLTEEQRKEMKDLRHELEKQVVDGANVILTTIDSSSKKVLKDIKVSTLIVDEATLADETSMVMPLSHNPDRLVLVGDPQQLNQLPNQQFSNEFQKSGYYQSLIDRIYSDTYDKRYHMSKLTVMLTIQYRMHPQIAAFSNNHFYRNQISNGVGEEDREINTQFQQCFTNSHGPMKHMVFINMNSEDDKESRIGSSYSNKGQALLVLVFIKIMIKCGIDPSNIGVISAYEAQVRLICNELNDDNIQNVKVSSIDSFQGCERDYIIFTTVRTSDIGYLKNTNRLNVALTRAKRCCIIIGNFSALTSYSLSKNIWYELIFGYIDKRLHSFYDYDQLPAAIRENVNKIRQGPISPFKENIYVLSKPNSVKSSIGGDDVRIFWPSNAKDRKELKRWVNEKLVDLNDGKNVTLAYDSEDVCFQFGDIFDHSFDLFNWKECDPIPKIKTNESIILNFYDFDNRDVKNPALINIMKPLLEHPRVTILTYDLTFDLNNLYDFGIRITTRRIIDAQLLRTPGDSILEERKDLICSTGWESLECFTQKTLEVDDVNAGIRSRAKQNINSCMKKFPHDENHFVIENAKLPKSTTFTKRFFEYSSDDIFLTAIAAIDVISRNQLDYVIQKTSEKVELFNQYYERYGSASMMRDLSYLKGKINLYCNSWFNLNNNNVSQLLNDYKNIQKLIKILDLNNQELMEELGADQETKEILKKQFEKIRVCLMKNENYNRIQKRAYLTPVPEYNPKIKKKYKKKIIFNF